MNYGFLEAKQIHRIKKVVDSMDLKGVRINSAGRLIIENIHADHVNEVIDILGKIGDLSRHRVTGCFGKNHCRFGFQDTQKMAASIEKMLVELSDTPSMIKVGISGCKRCCGESYVRDIGLIGTSKGWTLVFGGNAGRKVRCADEIANDISSNQVLRVIKQTLNYFTVHGNNKERTARFIERIGIVPLKNMVAKEKDMEQIRIDKDKCRLCGSCQDVCFRHLIRLSNNTIETSDMGQYCANCGQCQAVCPTGALLHTGIKQEEIQPIEKSTDITAEKFINFLKTRRSHRNFKTKQISEEMVELIAQSCNIAPSSSNDACVGRIIIQDRSKLLELSNLAIKHHSVSANETIIHFENFKLNKPLETKQANELERAYKMVRFLDSALPEQDPIFYHAPTVFFVHATPFSNFPKENALVAAHTALLTAHSLNLGTCYISLMAKAANESSIIRQLLNLPIENEVHAVIALGHPKYRYHRTTQARDMPIRIDDTVLAS